MWMEARQRVCRFLEVHGECGFRCRGERERGSFGEPCGGGRFGGVEAGIG